ncbi:beta-lactamase domain-containing protein 2-like [Elysia marginata]|uniref:Beta-lactamase domain-containing protein 2-like n=1 Tax=Elysia marginata TaxID=1093978 RepID=A0AAV4IRH3_9GAST|nr:beta-lactamase domain-containing protein 2-like [Elysia marginata]
MGKLKFPKPTGFVAPGFERVFQVFSDNYEKGLETGSNFAAHYRGELVINIWGGLADWQVKRAWSENTMGLFHSTTKFMAALTIAHLVERGKLKYGEKISTYWPEFAQNKKENITVEQLLSHRGGLAALSENFHFGWIRDDPQRLHDALAKQKPLWPPDTAYAYHPMTMGLYLNEIVKRVDPKRRPLSKYFQDEIAQPFGIEFYIGLPKSLYYRVARLEPMAVNIEKTAEMLSSFEGDADLSRLAFSQPKDWFSTRSLNDPDFLELPISSTHGVGTAQAVAKLMGILANGGQHEGKVMLRPESMAALQTPLSHGIDLTTGSNDIFGRGSQLLPVIEGEKSWFMFGHAGYGEQIAYADSHYRAGFAYTTNRVYPSMNKLDKEIKWKPLVQALFQCIHEIEGVQVERKLLDTMEELERNKKELVHKSRL